MVRKSTDHSDSYDRRRFGKGTRSTGDGTGYPWTEETQRRNSEAKQDSTQFASSGGIHTGQSRASSVKSPCKSFGDGYRSSRHSSEHRTATSRWNEPVTQQELPKLTNKTATTKDLVAEKHPSQELAHKDSP
ncbi:hypothetical protein FGSG_05980 [Fusarium graminearum PH-1]|uniref:hypothetical protein n=1 Tax=Gibberella zeae (strain ATCC MYA-4620 / CBS 123657 / FGSC 9075 / NRRL 31084 / PH-1) TaxID=229533 RepID=UPI00021F1B25|nr:hypothetical protein FGSG_05980 [Fusarium graminearum PH-1]ESU12019.1 hypothetical protein FGSG_05980 [Fusarium graminearum PH-1]|eukprot:XP_011324595.1 hypothetical protein FGSG_05980 [Fusarium graminearum PH-1]